MKKVLLAVPQQIRAAIEKSLNNTGRYLVVGSAFYKEAIIEKARELQPDIVIIQNAIKGSLTFDEVVYELKGSDPYMRVVFISNEEDKNLLSQLVLYGVYDIVVSTSLSLEKLTSILDNPRSIQDVVRYTRDNGMRQKSLEAANTILEENKEEGPKSSMLSGLFGKKKKEEPKKKETKWVTPPAANTTEAPIEESSEDTITEKVAPPEPKKAQEEVSNKTLGENEVEMPGKVFKEEPKNTKGSVEDILGEEPVTEEPKKEIRSVPSLSTSEKYEIIKKAAEDKEKDDLTEEQKGLLETAEEYANTCKDLFSKTETIKEKIRELRDEKSRLHTKMLDAKDDCYDLEKEVELLQKQLEEKQAGIEVNPEKRAELEEKIKELNAALSEIKTGSDFLEKKLEFLTASKRLYLFLDDNIPDDESPEVYEKVISSWKAESTGIKLSTSEMREEIIKLDTQLSEAEKEKIEVNTSLLSVKHNLQKTTDERDTLKEELLDTEKAFDDLNLELKELATKKKSLQQKIEGLNQSLNEEIKSISDFENLLNLPESTKAGDAIKSLNAEIKSIRQENEELKEKIENGVVSEDNLAEIEKKNTEIESLQKKLSDAERELGQRPSVKSYELLEGERDELKEEVFTLQTKIDTLSDNSKATQEAEKSLREADIIRNENKVLLDRIGDLEDEIDKIKIEKDELRKATPVVREETTVVIDGEVYTKNVVRPKRTLLPFSKQNSFTPEAPSARKIIAFVGAKQGIGNTYTSLNIAALLAKSSKVLFVEFDEVNPLSSYLFGFEQMGMNGNLVKGVEKSMVTTSTGKYNSVSEEIIKPKDCPIPKSLHFLTYSQEHLMGLSNNLNMLSGFDELFRRIKIEGDYDYIVADFPAAQNVATSELLTGKIYVDKVFMTLTQDIHTIACADKKLDKVTSVSERMARDMGFILLDYDAECKITVPAISSWLKADKSKIYPMMLNKAFVNDCLYEGEVYALIGEGYKPFEEMVQTISK